MSVTILENTLTDAKGSYQLAPQKKIEKKKEKKKKKREREREKRKREKEKKKKRSLAHP